MKIVIVENPRPATIEHYNDVANAPLSASLNSGYALAVSREAGWDATYLDLTGCLDDEAAIADNIFAANGDIILFHWVYAWGKEDVVREVMNLLKRSNAGFLGAFGLFPTLAYERLALYAPQLDFIVVGEFEATLKELLLNFGLSNRISPIAGIYSSNQQFIRRDLISDLSQLPVPEDVGANCEYSSINIAASRGCFGDCSFCFINQFYGCRRRRERSIASFEHELKLRMKRREVKNLYFIDPTFVGYDDSRKDRVKTISNIIKSHGLSFGFETRVDTLDQELVDVLVKNGATSVFLGIESGCNAALKRINKRIDKEQIIRAVRCIQDGSINLSVGFIMFEPDSTIDELFENYALLEELGLLAHHDQTINMLYHSQIVLYGSKAWSKFAQEGRLLLDGRLPFEASYKFKHGNVARVCNAMRRLSTEYFIRIDSLYRQQGIASSEQHVCCHTELPAGIKGMDLNLVLKEAFLTFVKQADTCDTRHFEVLEEGFVTNLTGCFSDSSLLIMS